MKEGEEMEIKQFSAQSRCVWVCCGGFTFTYVTSVQRGVQRRLGVTEARPGFYEALQIWPARSNLPQPRTHKPYDRQRERACDWKASQTPVQHALWGAAERHLSAACPYQSWLLLVQEGGFCTPILTSVSLYVPHCYVNSVCRRRNFSSTLITRHCETRAKFHAVFLQLGEGERDRINDSGIQVCFHWSSKLLCYSTD